MNQPFRRDQPDTDAVKRTRALDYSIDQSAPGRKRAHRRGAWRDARVAAAVLEDVHRRLQSMMNELRALQ